MKKYKAGENQLHFFLSLRTNLGSKNIPFSGQFLKFVVDDLQNKVNNHSVQRLHLYSGNTYGLSAIMNTLGIFNSLVPLPASALLFEFREKNHRQIITVRFEI